MHRKGFTLIELLVVIAIIGILATVVLGALNAARQRARDAKRISDMKSIQLGMTLVFDACNGYMSRATAAVLVGTDAPCTGVAISTYFPTILVNATPANGTPDYLYCSATGGTPDTCAASTESYIVTFGLEQPTSGLTAANTHKAEPNELKN